MSARSPGESRLTFIVYLALLLAILAGIAVIVTQQPATSTISIIPPPPTSTAAPMTIYVSGAVAQPGVYALPISSRVQDALQAAGGIGPEADLTRVNLAAPIRDGDQIHVARIGEANPVLATPSGGVRLNVNTATLEELDTLPGIGPALAQRIVEYRTLAGPITSLDGLAMIEGIGDALLAELAPLIRFD